MPTTSNFGWTTPADTDLVKNGALAIRTLGNGIDTSMAELKGGTTGQVLSKASNTDMDFTWTTDASGISPTIVDAKGDLIAASAADTPARLAVGNNGETLVADSSTSTGLRWQGNFAAGKNAIINGDFTINQRAFSSTTTTGTYGFDRWFYDTAGGTGTYSAQTFTAGAAPVTGYEGTNFARLVTTGQSAAGDRTVFTQYIENVRTFANQTVTISFWAKAASSTPKIAVELAQGFGSGGSPSSAVLTYAGQVTLSTSWARYSVTVAVPSISGKTIGTTANTSSLGLNLWVSAGTNFNARTGSLGIQSNTFDIWGVQVEAGSVATAFETATGTLAGELAACQRYYMRYSFDAINTWMGVGNAGSGSTTQFYPMIKLSVPMRIKPQSVDYSGLGWWNGGNQTSVSSITINAANPDFAMLTANTTGLTANNVYMLGSATTSAYLAFSAEL